MIVNCRLLDSRLVSRPRPTLGGPSPRALAGGKIEQVSQRRAIATSLVSAGDLVSVEVPGAALEEQAWPLACDHFSRHVELHTEP